MAPLAVEIRPAEPADVPELARLAQRSWVDAFGAGLSAADVAADVEQRRSEAVFMRVLVDHDLLLAVQAGALVGYAMCGGVDEDITQLVCATAADRELNRLYVDTTRHRSGVGTALLSACLELPPMAEAERVFLTVWVQNLPAVSLYERFGFTPVGTLDYRIGATQVVDSVMMRPRPF
jgi:ribosomal protein S18 acetylase RimI-like enzyme